MFNADSGRLLDVAIDHGIFGEPSFLTGLEDPIAAIHTLVEANPDVIQLTPGLAPILQSIKSRNKPALLVRTDVANVYGNPLDSHLFSVHAEDAIERAVRLDAACVVANLLNVPGHPELREYTIKTILDLRKAADRYGMPLMIEPLVMQDTAQGGAYMVDGDADKIVALVRLAVELGADLVKADPTTNPEDYHRVIQTAGNVPVLVRGGGKVSDHELLTRTEEVLKQGARGIVYGRNIVQHPNPAGITRALMAVVHQGLSVENALALTAESVSA
jgi:DhnA family fructose-bisphosphate aldolase class Ia